MTKRLIRQVGYKPSRYIPASVRHRVFERDNYTCSFCGSQKDLTLDHYVALSLGGTHDESNLVTACRSCIDVVTRVRESGPGSNDGHVSGSLRRCEVLRGQTSSKIAQQQSGQPHTDG